MNNISRIVYINLDTRTDRRIHMERMLSRLNLPYRRFEAVKPDPETLLLDGDPYNSFYKKSAKRIRMFCENDRTKRRGAGIIGCYASHYNILKEHKGGHLLVLEDDADFNQSFLNKLNRRISRELSPTDWDMIRCVWPYVSKSLRRHSDLGQVVSESFVKWVSYKKRIDVDRDFLPNKARYNVLKNRSKSMAGGTTFQIINKNSIDKILKTLEESPIDNIDGMYSRLLADSYIYSPSNILENIDAISGNSSILRSDIPKVSL